MSGNFTNNCCAEEPAKDGFYLATSTWPSSAVILTTILMITVNVVTIIGNAFVIGALANIDALKIMANNQVVISLAVADLLVGVLVTPCAIDSVMAGKWRCGYLWGRLNAFGNFSFCISSIMHLALLSVDRYIAITRPLVYSSEVTKKRARVACLLLWIYSTVWALPPLFGVSPYECFIPYIGNCPKEDWMNSKASVMFTALVVCGTYGVAILVMCFVYAKIYINISDQSKRISATAKQLRTNSNLATTARNASAKKGALTVLIVIGTYVACWSPFCLLLFTQMARGKKVGGPTVDLTTMFIGFANSACNPIIYSIRYTAFRQTVKRVFVKKNNFFGITSGKLNSN
ncbi:G-protein coupled receptor 161-like [Oculina patagonica]